MSTRLSQSQQAHFWDNPCGRVDRTAWCLGFKDPTNGIIAADAGCTGYRVPVVLELPRPPWGICAVYVI